MLQRAHKHVWPVVRAAVEDSSQQSADHNSDLDWNVSVGFSPRLPPCAALDKDASIRVC